MKRMGFDTFIFDLDGTILHTLPDLVVLTNAVLREEGYPERTEAQILSYVGNGVRALMHQAVPEGLDEQAADRALERWKDLFPLYENKLTQPYEGVPELLAQLRQRGCRLGVVSNKFDLGVQQVMAQHLPGAVDVAHGEGPGFPRKPDPTGLLRAIAELGSTPERTVYVGDSPGDVLAARNAGAFAVGVSWGYHEVEDFAREGATPDVMLDAPLDLLQLAPAPKDAQ